MATSSSPLDPLPLTEPVETEHGQVVGFTIGRTSKFLGIPYGRSTGGSARFRPPGPPEPWTGVRLTTQHGLSAPQLQGQPSRYFGWYRSPYGWSEDCLSLDVFCSASDRNRRRPVLVWLHGGGFASGSGTSFAFDGTHLSERGDVVLVNVNHRLNLFGFLYLGDNQTNAFNPNVGMLDIVAALKWVRANIEQFGGDPDNVTIFGESGGGAKVGTLMAMPSAVGLFHKAVIQSAGSGYVALTPDQALSHSRQLMEKLGLSAQETSKLQDLPPTALLKGLSDMQTDVWVDFFRPVVDGAVLPENPFAPNAPLLAKHIPMMIGCTAQESTFALARDEANFEMTRRDAVTRIGAFLGEEAENVFDSYAAAHPSFTPCDVYVEVNNDFRFKQRLVMAALKRVDEKSAPTFVYCFAWKSPAMGGRLKAVHTIELPFVFDNTDLLSVLVGESSEVPMLAAKISQAWIAFARHGDPQHSDLPPWPAFSRAERATMVFDTPCVSVSDIPSPERLSLLPFQPELMRSCGPVPGDRAA